MLGQNNLLLLLYFLVIGHYAKYMDIYCVITFNFIWYSDIKNMKRTFREVAFIAISFLELYNAQARIRVATNYHLCLNANENMK